MDFKKYHKKYYSELFDYVLPFWQDNSPDKVFGGIYNCLDEKGDVYSTDKSVWAQGRAAYIFSKLCNTYGVRQEWIDIAKSCIDFLTNYCIDKDDGRMYFTVTDDGKPLRKRRYIFSETFYIIGLAEYYKATEDKEYLEIAKKYYELVWNIYLDGKNDPFQIHPKTYSETRDTKAFGMPMILLNVTSVMRECDGDNTSLYNARSLKLIEDIKRNFIKPELKCVLESVSSEGEFLSDVSSGRIVNPGHSIEGAWFLLGEMTYLKDETLLETAKNMFKWSIDLGWDDEFGGITYFKDILGKPPEQYEHDMKLWWPQLEALIASLMLYKNTNDDYFAKWFQKIDEYAYKHLSDHESGDWYGYLHRDGTPTLPACKGSTYKSGFHLIRALIMVEQMLKQD